MAEAGRRQLFVGFAVLGSLLVAAAFAAPQFVPDADPADLVTRLTARVALLFWWLAVAALMIRCRAFGRAAWMVGAATFLVHVATAFDRVHGWSHAAAYRHVETVSGFGAGVFVSYTFTAIWVADAIWWWVDETGYESRPRWLDGLVHGFLAFVVFNGTVVYETGFIRWAGLISFTLLGVLLMTRAPNWIAARQ
jgi:hypothetical protein